MRGYEEKHEKKDIQNTEEKKRKKKMWGVTGKGSFLQLQQPLAHWSNQHTGAWLLGRDSGVEGRERSRQRRRRQPHPNPFTSTPCLTPLQTTLQVPGSMTGIIPECVSLERHPPDGFSHTSSRHFLCSLSASMCVSAVTQERLQVYEVGISER